MKDDDVLERAEAMKPPLSNDRALIAEMLAALEEAAVIINAEFSEIPDEIKAAIAKAKGLKS